MRLTNVLLKESHRWRFKMLWAHKAQYVESPLITPFKNDKGFQVIKGADLVKSRLEFPKWEPPVSDDVQFMDPKTEKDHPDYHEDHVYEFSHVTRLMEGEPQALLLTKSKPFYELPSAVKDLTERLEFPDQDLLVQRAIMQANVWNPTKLKLPRRFNPKLPGWHFKAEFGIPALQVASITAKNLLRLCESFGAWHPDLLFSRRQAIDSFLSTFYYTQGEKHVMIRGKQTATVFSNGPIKPFASQDVVDESAVYSLPEMYPLIPTIDLIKQHIWRPEDISGFKAGYTHPHPHTVVMCYENWWNASQHNAKSLMFCFGHALASAKQRFGSDVKTLPEPISVQCILTNGFKFHFTCFQLNTLDFSTNNGIKNLVWFDSDNALFNKILPKRAMLRNTKYEDYNPEVFKKFLALYLNGAQLANNSS